MDYVPIDKESIRKQLVEAEYQIEKIFCFVEKLKKSIIELSKLRGLYSYTIHNTEDNKPTKIENAKNKKEPILENIEFVKKLNEMLKPNLSEIEKLRLMNNKSHEAANLIVRQLLKQGYTEQSIQQAVYNATRDEFWSKQFRSLAKLRRKNKDGVYYIDVFLAMNQKSTKISIPKIVR